MIQETTLRVNDLIYPLFVCPGSSVKTEISSMPGQYRLSIDQLVEECLKVRDMGIPAVILFGGFFMTVCDGIARTLLAPVEMPAGLITALLGGPFFIWLLVRGRS